MILRRSLNKVFYCVIINGVLAECSNLQYRILLADFVIARFHLWNRGNL